MKARAGVVLVLALVVVAHAGSATNPKVEQVAVQFSAYGPSQLDVLPGETVSWSNVSQRTHTVTSDAGLFDSDRLDPGARFTFVFNSPGTYRYHCTILSSIRGEVDVRRVILEALPTAAVPQGDRVEFAGRTFAASRPVRIERRVAGSRFATIATVRPAADGTWRTELRAEATGDYRAAVGSDASEVRRMIVGVRKVELRPTRAGLDVSVNPSAPYAPVLVEEYLKERFGWWPVARARLDYVSEAQIRVRRRPARVRVVLVDRDGWTPIATSRAVTLR
jgi:plastocyanin